MVPKELFEWTDALATGIAEIDEQHRILVNTLNEVSSKLAVNPNHQLFDQITRDLLAYAIYHFDSEERLMQCHGYDVDEHEDAQTHVQQHRSFTNQVIELRAAAHGGRAASQDALLTFLRDWLRDHISTTDQRLGKFVRQHTIDAQRL